MRRSLRWRSRWVIAVAVGSLAACTTPNGSDEHGADSSPDQLCELLSVPITSLASADRTFAEAVRPEDGKGVGLGAMVLLATGREAPEAGEFEPVVTFLAERAWVVLEREQGRVVAEPELTAEIEANAAALDQELGRGRCGT